MKHLYTTLFVILALSKINYNYAQVGVGTTTPDSSSILDIRSTNKGVLFPKVTLQGPNTVAPLTNPAKGLIVWNTGSTWGSPGFYYNDSNSVTPSWVKIAAGAVMQNTLTNGKVWIGNVSNIGTEQTMSGDFTMTNTGVSDITNDSVSGAKINITGNSNGSLMYYDGTDWVNLAPDTAGKILITNGAGAPTWVNANTLNVNNIYTADGALTGNRIVSQGANRLTFSSSAINGFNVNDTLFSVDAVNRRIGIGTKTPSYPIHEKRNGEGSIFIENTATGGGSVALFTPTSSSTGGVGTWTNNDFPIFTNNIDRITVKATTGNVGIGTLTPGVRLHVLQNDTNAIVRIESPGNLYDARLELKKFGSLGNSSIGFFPGTADLRFRNFNATDFLFEQANTELVRIKSNGNVGIGTSTPTNKLEVAGNIKTTNFQMTSGAANGYVLKSDAAGNGSWVNPNTTLTKKDVITTTTGVSIVNGTSQVVGDSNVTINIATNSATSPGLVSTAAGQNTKVWGTDASGNPSWKDIGTMLDAQNGLRMDTTSPNASATQPYVELGGPLVRNTTITQGNFNYTQDLTGTGSYRINHSNTTVATNSTYPFGINRAGSTDFTLGSDATYAYLQSWNSKPLQINNQGNNILLNPNSGSVGIGTTVPIGKFDVESPTQYGTNSGTSRFFGNNGNPNNAGVFEGNNNGLQSGATTIYTKAHLAGFQTTQLGTINYGVLGHYFGTGAGGYGGIFSYGASITAGTQYVALAGSTYSGLFMGGNVGIGINTPANKLDIANATRSGTHASGRALYVTGTFGSNNSGVEFRHDNGTQGIGFGFNTIYAAGSNASQDLGLQSLSTGNLNFTTNSAQRMIILGSNGNIGMGLTNPAYGLELNGTFGYGNGTPGSYRSRTETRDDAGQQATQSGFFETSVPTNYPTGATSWWHLIDVRHSNNANNYAMQIAGSFFDQDLYFRKTNSSATTTWSKLLTSKSGWTLNGNAGTNDPTAPVTYGTSTIGASENYMGTTDANDVVFGTNNIERMRVKQTNGFVGIGTASPAQNLQVTGNALTTGDMYIRNNLGASNFIGSIHHGVNGRLGQTTAYNPNAGLEGLWLEGSNDGESAGLFLNGNTAILWSPGDADIFRVYDEDVLPSGNPAFVIDGSGEVGIGVNAPVASLEIGGNPTNAFRTAYFNISSNNNPTTDRPYFRGGLDHLVIAPRTTGVSTMYLAYPGDLTAGSTVTTRIQESIFISATGSGGNGNVGIGTSTPGAKFDVLAGNVVGMRLLSGNAGQYAGLQIGRATPDFSLGIAAVAGNWSSDAAIGDVVIRTESTNRLILQSGTGNSDLMIRGDGRIQVGNLNNSWFAFADFAVAKDNNNNAYTAGFRNITNAAGVSNNGIFVIGGQNTFGQTQFLQVFARPDGTGIGSITQNSSTSIAYNTTSDIRLKTNLTESKYGLNTINKIQVKDYFYKEDLTRQQNGFIAQQLYEVYPHAVTVGGEDSKEFPWMVDYSKLTPPLVKAVQELSKENDDLKKVIENLTKRLEVLEQK